MNSYTKQDGAQTFGITLIGMLVLGYFAGMILTDDVLGVALTVILLQSLWVVCVLIGSRNIKKQGDGTGFASRVKVITKETKANVKISPMNVLWLIAIALVGVWFFNPLTEVLLDLVKLTGYKPDSMVFDMTNFGLFALAILLFCILPSIFEEFLFRGVILQSFKELGKVGAVLMSGLLFSLFHLSPAQTFFQFYLGCVCALAVIKTGSLWGGVIVHFVNNAFIIAYTYITKGALLTFVWWEIVLMTIIGAGLVWMFFKQLKSNRRLEFKKTKKLNLFEDGLLLFVVVVAIVIWFTVLLG